MERQLLQKSLRNNEVMLANFEELIFLLSDAIISDDRRLLVFRTFSNQVKHDLILSLLSTLRYQETQSKLMKRQAIEKACLAAYSLIEPNIEKFLVLDENGALPISKALDRSYKYVDKELPSHSKRLKQVKDMVNNFYAHGNLFNSLKKEEHFSFFDKRDDLIQKILIWETGYLATVILDLWYHLVDQCNYAKKNEQIYRKFVHAVVINQRFREEFVNHERFAKYKLLF